MPERSGHSHGVQFHYNNAPSAHLGMSVIVVLRGQFIRDEQHSHNLGKQAMARLAVYWFVSLSNFSLETIDEDHVLDVSMADLGAESLTAVEDDVAPIEGGANPVRLNTFPTIPCAGDVWLAMQMCPVQ